MDLRDASIVVNQRAVVGTFRVGQASLSVKQQVERDRTGLVSRLHSSDLLLRSNSAVQLRLGDNVVGFQVANCVAQLMIQFQLLVCQNCLGLGQQLLLVTNG